MRGGSALRWLPPAAPRSVTGLALRLVAGRLAALGRGPSLTLRRSLLWSSLGTLLLASLVRLGLAGLAPPWLPALGLSWSATLARWSALLWLAAGLVASARTRRTAWLGGATGRRRPSLAARLPPRLSASSLLPGGLLAVGLSPRSLLSWRLLRRLALRWLTLRLLAVTSWDLVGRYPLARQAGPVAGRGTTAFLGPALLPGLLAGGRPGLPATARLSRRGRPVGTRAALLVGMPTYRLLAVLVPGFPLGRPLFAARLLVFAVRGRRFLRGFGVLGRQRLLLRRLLLGSRLSVRLLFVALLLVSSLARTLLALRVCREELASPRVPWLLLGLLALLLAELLGLTLVVGLPVGVASTLVFGVVLGTHENLPSVRMAGTENLPRPAIKVG